AGALDLVEQIRSQAVVEDTLAPAAPARGRIAVLTPAQLAAEHRDTVVLARVQEGAWHDLRLRSTLIGAAQLSLWAGARRRAVLAPTQLAGGPRATVVLGRVQEGAWPDLRLRSTLFGAAELSLWAGARRGAGLPLEADALRALQREQVIADELRLAVSALS